MMPVNQPNDISAGKGGAARIMRLMTKNAREGIRQVFRGFVIVVSVGMIGLCLQASLSNPPHLGALLARLSDGKVAPSPSLAQDVKDDQEDVNSYVSSFTIALVIFCILFLLLLGRIPFGGRWLSSLIISVLMGAGIYNLFAGYSIGMASLAHARGLAKDNLLKYCRWTLLIIVIAMFVYHFVKAVMEFIEGEEEEDGRYQQDGPEQPVHQEMQQPGAGQPGPEQVDLRGPGPVQSGFGQRLARGWEIIRRRFLKIRRQTEPGPMIGEADGGLDLEMGLRNDLLFVSGPSQVDNDDEKPMLEQVAQAGGHPGPAQVENEDWLDLERGISHSLGHGRLGRDQGCELSRFSGPLKGD